MVRPLLVSLVVLGSVPALAEECVVTAGPRDRVGRGKTVVVEPGESLDDVLVGGRIQVSPGAKVAGSRLQLSDGLQLRSEDGKDLGLALSIAGRDVSRLLVAKLVEKARSCRFETETGQIRL